MQASLCSYIGDYIADSIVIPEDYIVDSIGISLCSYSEDYIAYSNYNSYTVIPVLPAM